MAGRVVWNRPVPGVGPKEPAGEPQAATGEPPAGRRAPAPAGEPAPATESTTSRLLDAKRRAARTPPPGEAGTDT